jgi:hypothetical protein
VCVIPETGEIYSSRRPCSQLEIDTAICASKISLGAGDRVHTIMAIGVECRSSRDQELDALPSVAQVLSHWHSRLGSFWNPERGCRGLAHMCGRSGG